MKDLLDHIKSNPLTFLGELAFLIVLFVGFWASLWIFCPCGG
jgi:hypothetical protein